MTTVITRYFEDAERARTVRYELMYRRGFPDDILEVYDEAEGLAETLADQHVKPDTAQAYQDRVVNGGAVLLVRATYRPLGVAGIFREVTAERGAVDLGSLKEEVFVKAPRGSSQVKILKDHPLILTRRKDPNRTNFHMADWPIPLIIRRVPDPESAAPSHDHVTDSLYPLLSDREPKDNFAFPRHARMANWPIPLISRRKPNDSFAFPRHARMADWPIPLISRRKPYTGSIIGRHPFMANWPFPHLINGKGGTNSLIPGGPRMANFPIPLISRREPNTASIFPRHARMANWPIPLISRRKPYTGSAIPRHARMADAILPLVIRRPSDPAPDEEAVVPNSTRFSFSKMLGLPTLIRR